jgi:hypothetical protein
VKFIRAPKIITKKSISHLWTAGIAFFVLVGGANSLAQQQTSKIKTKRQYIENDSYFKTSRMNSVTAKMSKEEKPWGIGLHMSSGADLADADGDRQYTHGISFSGAYEIDKTKSVGVGSGVSYYSISNNIPKEEGNPKWDDISLSLSHSLGEINNLKLSHSVSTFAPTSYDSQYEGIKTGLSYGLSLAHQLYFIKFGHNLSVNYTQHEFDYSPTTNRKNSPWSNSYTVSVSSSYKFNKSFSLGASQNASNRSAFDNQYILVTSTLLYAGWNVGGVKISANYKVGSYDDNDSIRFFYVNEWKQSVNVGLSYDL